MKVTNRYVAFLVHILISFFLFVFLAAIIKFLWFPGFLFEVDGGWDGIKLIVGVDVVIGPLLTLFVYNINKPELKRDLLIIGLLQCICLVGGMIVVERVRPIAVIYTNSTFFTASRQRFEDAGVDISTIPLLQESKPVWIGVMLPSDPAEKAIVYTQAKMLGGLDMSTDLYKPYSSVLETLASDGASLMEAEQKGLNIPGKWKDVSDVRVFNLKTRYLVGFVLVNIKSGEVLELVSKAQTTTKAGINPP